MMDPRSGDGSPAEEEAFMETLTRPTADTIGREELKEKLERGDHFTLVMALGEAPHRAGRIPGSVTYPTFAAVLAALDPDEEIVVYCSGWPCAASQMAQRVLRGRGYRAVRRYEGGLQDWEAAGYGLEGVTIR
jgi:rhodanese-related sulfurtransferase